MGFALRCARFTLKGKNMNALSRILVLSTAAFLVSIPVVAQTVTQQGDTQHTHYSDNPTRVNINANVQEEIAPDTVRLVFAKQIGGKNQQELSETLNKALNAVLKAGKAHSELTLSNGNYGFWKTGEKGELWEMRGEVIVSSTDFEKARAFIGEVGEWMSLDGISFYLSPAKTAEMENKLLEQAAQAFKDKASRVTKAFGAKEYHIDNVRLDAGYGGPQPRMAMAMFKVGAAASLPPNEGLNFECGKVRFSVNADGQISLKN